LAIDPNNSDIPTEFSLHQNYPNPFNPTTTITYALPKKEDVTLTIFNSLGRKIRTLVNEQQVAGNYEIKWDGTDDNGKAVPSGIYFYQLKAGTFTETKKMTLMK
jgi:flagellar hook assembly protein FlgD